MNARTRKQMLGVVSFCAVLLSFFVFPPEGRTGGYVDDWITSKISTGGQYFEGEKRGYATGGVYSARWPNNNDYLVTVEPPRFRTGCGGIDVFMGGVSFLDFDYLVQKMQNILMSGGAVAFDLALKTLCESCSTVVNSMEGLNNLLNQTQINECAAGTWLGQTAHDKFLAPAIEESRISRGIDNLAHAVGEVFRGKTPSGKVDAADAEPLVEGCDDSWKEAVLGMDAGGNLNGGSLIENVGVRRLGLSAEFAELARGMVGDIIISDPAGAFEVRYIAPCPENDAMSIGSFIDGEVFARAVVGGVEQACAQITDMNGDLRAYMLTTISGIADKIEQAQPLSPAEEAFLQNSPMAMNTVLRTAIVTGLKDATVANLAEVTAKQYAMAMLSDLYSRVRHVYGKARESLEGGRPRANANAMSCLPITNEEIRQNLELLQAKVSDTLFQVRDSYAVSYEELTATLELINHYKELDRQLYDEIARRFGESVAARMMR